MAEPSMVPGAASQWIAQPATQAQLPSRPGKHRSGLIRSDGLLPTATSGQPRAYTMVQYGGPSTMSYTTLATYVDVMFQPSNEQIAAASHQAGMYVLGYFDSNACSGRTLTDGNGLGANVYAAPDCSNLPASDFYQQAVTGYGLTTSDGGANPNGIGGVLQYAGNPNSAGLRAAVNATVTAQYGSNYNGVLDDDVFNLDEAFNNGNPFLTLCNGIGTFNVPEGSLLGYSCNNAPGGALTAVNGGTDIAAYSASSYFTGQEGLINNLPLPAVLNSIQSYVAGETTSAAAQITVASENAVGAFCESCFENNVYELQETLQNFQSVIAANKAVISSSESSTLTPTQRESNLAALMLVYSPGLVYESASPSCTGPSHLNLCPEVSLVFSPTQNYQRASNGLLTRTGTCDVYGISYGSCFTEVNDNVGASVKTVNPPGAMGVEELVPNTSTDYTTCVQTQSCFYSSPSTLIPTTLSPGQGVIGLVLL